MVIKITEIPDEIHEYDPKELDDDIIKEFEEETSKVALEDGSITEEFFEWSKDKFNDETGKRAIWRKVVTESFKKWLRGEKVYSRDKERFSFYLSEEEKKDWQEFTDKQENMTISKLIRNSVRFYIEFKSKIPNLEKPATISHELKQDLTIIKGYAELLMKGHREKIPNDVYSMVKEIFEKSVSLENKINEVLEDKKPPASNYDVLIIDDDPPIVQLLSNILESKDFKCKGLPNATNLMETLKRDGAPKIILLDVTLPGQDGYSACEMIKNSDEFKDVPVYLISAMPAYEIEENLAKSDADGYIPKPFKLEDLNILDQYK